jgi:hypothetical protein
MVLLLFGGIRLVVLVGWILLGVLVVRHLFLRLGGVARRCACAHPAVGFRRMHSQTWQALML